MSLLIRGFSRVATHNIFIAGFLLGNLNRLVAESWHLNGRDHIHVFIRVVLYVGFSIDVVAIPNSRGLSLLKW